MTLRHNISAQCIRRILVLPVGVAKKKQSALSFLFQQRHVFTSHIAAARTVEGIPTCRVKRGNGISRVDVT